MRFPWEKKRPQWIPQERMLPHPRIVAQRPELRNIEDNPHFRMTLARSDSAMLPGSVFAACLAIPLIVYPWFIPFLLPSDIKLGQDFYWFVTVAGVWIYFILFIGLRERKRIPMTSEWTRKHFLPESRNILSDYLIVGLSGRTIIAGHFALQFRRERYSLHWTLIAIGLAAPIPSYLLHPTSDMYWSRLVILSAALLRLGPQLWPTGIAARAVLGAAKTYRAQVDMRRRPLRYAGRFFLMLSLLILGVVVLVTLLAMIVAPLVRAIDNRPLWIYLWEELKWVSPMIFLPGFLAGGVLYARVALRGEQRGLERAVRLVDEVLEWKRDEFFDRQGSK